MSRKMGFYEGFDQYGSCIHPSTVDNYACWTTMMKGCIQVWLAQSTEPAVVTISWSKIGYFHTSIVNGEYISTARNWSGTHCSKCKATSGLQNLSHLLGTRNILDVAWYGAIAKADGGHQSTQHFASLAQLVRYPTP